jgi:hypothetical protein
MKPVRWTKTCRDITGTRFERLVVVGLKGRSKAETLLWSCRCDCGNSVIAPTNDLLRGNYKSCGCLQRERSAERLLKHGHAKTLEYRIWGTMISRCENPNHIAFADYGGRGIKVCDRWKNSVSDFISDMGPRPSRKHSIDRKDSNGDYEPCNCRWATPKEQSRNTSRNRFVTYGVETLTLAEWGERNGLRGSLIGNRLKAGWSVEDALTRAARPMSRRYEGN